MSNPRRIPMTGLDSSVLNIKTNLVLKKGATFHSPTTPTSSSENVFRPPSPPRRSHSNLDDVIDSHRRRVALTLDDIDKALAGLSTDDSSAAASRKALRDNSLPIPRGVLDHTLDSAMGKAQPAERRVLRPRTRRTSRTHQTDSGLGTSIASITDKEAAVKKEKMSKTSAVTKSAAACTSTAMSLPSLSSRAMSRICEHTLKPLLGNSSFRDFHPLLLECPGKIQEKQIVCLRDLEKTLLLVAPERTKAADLYLDFCLTTIRCIQATVEYLSDREQTRPRDVPYSSGYFIDLVDQIRQYAQQLADAKEKDNKDEMDIDPYDYTIRPARATFTDMFSSTDEIKLHGGIHINGRPAELVRIKKNGKMISMATGEPIEDDAESVAGFKRSASQELEDEEEIMRSMARRKKNASPEELAPKKCREVGCNKEFKRPCDLTKHEKTHSRPWKCPVPTCKYHEYGWPTEKEMDRHHNDKHSSAPPMYECLYKPCPYKSKRESNCKQHMEKAHGWTYVRTKTNGKKSGSSVEGGSAHPTPQLQNIATPSSDHSMGVATPPDEWSHIYGHSLDFPAYVPNDADYTMIPQELSLDYSPMDHSTPSTDSGLDHNSAYQDIQTDFTLYDDIYSAPVQLPTPPMHASIYNKHATQHYVPFTTGLCRPQPAQLSPIGQGNAMLYTPNSLSELDEGFDERRGYANMANMAGGGDFILFPHVGGVSKPMYNESLFATTELPSLTAGYSQPSSQDLLSTFQVDWSAHDLSAYLP
ncbi:hypothetical protein BT67DRAFT_429612 [Trichocladium antarcticum]|uniref:C2H2-type domain-containing protein n=1 Tax=Trichocladium antarcticum TaxID=1450529 RepID=A0AAN6UCW5_9PEZI|nr:hypothetical protein BT67DRAFT_429612 [Trichocladium antarcticum]